MLFAQVFANAIICLYITLLTYTEIHESNACNLCSPFIFTILSLIDVDTEIHESNACNLCLTFIFTIHESNACNLCLTFDLYLHNSQIFFKHAESYINNYKVDFATFLFE